MQPPTIEKKGRSVQKKAASPPKAPDKTPRFSPVAGAPDAQAPDSVEIGAAPFWCGTFDDSPRQNIVLAGVLFPKTSEIVWDTPGSYRTKRATNRGIVVYLTDETVERVKEAAIGKVVRREGSFQSVRSMKDGRYKPHTGDVPIGHFVYMVPMDEAQESGPFWRDSEPVPLIS